VTGLFDGGPGWLNILSEAPQLHAKYAWIILDDYVSDPTWTPDAGTFLKSGLGKGDDEAASGYSSRAALVYFPASRPIIIDTTKIVKGSNVRLRWYDPSSGNYTMIAKLEAKTPNRSLAYPSKPHSDGFNDWVLLVDGRWTLDYGYKKFNFRGIAQGVIILPISKHAFAKQAHVHRDQREQKRDAECRRRGQMPGRFPAQQQRAQAFRQMMQRI
jgi:hypothetical protein